MSTSHRACSLESLAKDLSMSNVKNVEISGVGFRESSAHSSLELHRRTSLSPNCAFVPCLSWRYLKCHQGGSLKSCCNCEKVLKIPY